MGVLREPVQGQTAVQSSLPNEVVHPTQGGTGQSRSDRNDQNTTGTPRVLHEHVAETSRWASALAANVADAAVGEVGAARHRGDPDDDRVCPAHDAAVNRPRPFGIEVFAADASQQRGVGIDLQRLGVVADPRPHDR